MVAARARVQIVAPQSKRAPALPGPPNQRFRGLHLPALPSWLDTLENVFLSWPPSELTTAMMATEMPAAMRPYSMAVAPDSSFANCTRVFMGYSWIHELGP